MVDVQLPLDAAVARFGIPVPPGNSGRGFSGRKIGGEQNHLDRRPRQLAAFIEALSARYNAGARTARPREHGEQIMSSRGRAIRAPIQARMSVTIRP